MSEYNMINNIHGYNDFFNLTRENKVAYKKWFFENESLRLAELRKKVKQSGFSDLNLDFSPESLIGLGDFMAASIRTRPRTELEIAAYRSKLPSYIDICPWDLTDESYSLIIDIGIYWGNVLIKNHPELSWSQDKTKSRRNIDYGHIVIELNPLKCVNPCWMMNVSASEVADGTFDRNKLYRQYLLSSEQHELYLRWCKEFGTLDKKTFREMYLQWWDERKNKSADQENQAIKSDKKYKSENKENKNNLINNFPTPEELEAYKKCFFENESLRITDLKNKVKQSDFSDLDLDFSPESLIGLGDFMVASIRTRPRTELEMEKAMEEAKAKNNISVHEDIVIPPLDLTDETYSLFTDIGIYWGNVLIKNHPTENLSWSQYLHKKRKNNDDYGQMVIQVNPRSYVNPLLMMKIIAKHVVYGIYKSNSVYSLYQIYLHWSKKVKKASEQ